MNTREQGDFGEMSALLWLWGMGYRVAVPLGHSPDYDLLAEIDHRVVRVQVKTTTVFRKRWELTVCTRGGNQSWNGLVKLLDPSRCDYLFAHVGDGRRWFIPSSELGGGSHIALGGPKYAGFEIEPGPPILRASAAA
jgi:hypothetical protein